VADRSLEGRYGLSTMLAPLRGGQSLRRCFARLIQGSYKRDYRCVRILTVGIDVDLLTTRQAVLTSRGYDSPIATPGDVDEKLQSGRFDLVILSVMLSQDEKRRIQAKLPAGTRALVLESLVWPNELLRMVAEVLG
jgi:hypothetical protein